MTENNLLPTYRDPRRRKEGGVHRLRYFVYVLFFLHPFQEDQGPGLFLLIPFTDTLGSLVASLFNPSMQDNRWSERKVGDSITRREGGGFQRHHYWREGTGRGEGLETSPTLHW